MLADPTSARAFIRQQLGVFTLQGITTMTARQLERIERGEVIAESRKQEAAAFIEATRRYYGPGPRRGGRMRRSNLHSGEVSPLVAVPVQAAA